MIRRRNTAAWSASLCVLLLLLRIAHADELPVAPTTTEPPAPAVAEPVAEPVAPPTPTQAAALPFVAATPPPLPEPSSGPERNLAGSVQLDYLAMKNRSALPDQGLSGATVELSIKLGLDFGEHVSSSVKVCYACHGFEVGMAYFDLRAADELNFRAGRFTPSFGSFPLRHDPANHNTSDKPLIYDMGRMVRIREWNEGVLPAPWVDNGLELNGSHFFSKTAQLDYAVYAINGPKGDNDAVDLDFKQSRSPERYYGDNNGEPTLGGRLVGTLDISNAIAAVGASVMAGHYDPAGKLGFLITGADASLQIGRVTTRAEYVRRRTEISLGDDPASRFKYGPGADGQFADFVVKDGFTLESEVKLGRVQLIGRWDGLRQVGNVLATSDLRARSAVLRYTAATAVRITGALKVKTGLELYDFSDFDDELVLHIGLAGPF